MSFYPSHERRAQLDVASRLMGDTKWKNLIGVPEHDHMIGGETAMVTGTDGRLTFARLHNCPRCGQAAADRLWPLALDEAERRLIIRDAEDAARQVPA
jgi:hypothetical protein